MQFADAKIKVQLNTSYTTKFRGRGLTTKVTNWAKSLAADPPVSVRQRSNLQDRLNAVAYDTLTSSESDNVERHVILDDCSQATLPNLKGYLRHEKSEWQKCLINLDLITDYFMISLNNLRVREVF